jgi:hypothetical protein
MTCRHQLRLGPDGAVSAGGTAEGCLIIFVASDASTKIREAATALGCETEVDNACPFAEQDLWRHCPSYQRRRT